MNTYIHQLFETPVVVRFYEWLIGYDQFVTRKLDIGSMLPLEHDHTIPLMSKLLLEQYMIRTHSMIRPNDISNYWIVCYMITLKYYVDVDDDLKAATMVARVIPGLDPAKYCMLEGKILEGLEWSILVPSTGLE